MSDLSPDAKAKMRFRYGVMTVIGGFLIQMFNGSFFLWSNISIYILSYMYQFNPSVNQNA